MNQNEIKELVKRFFDTFKGEMGLPELVIRNARSEKLLLVKNLTGNPSYWIALVTYHHRIAGFLHIGLDGKLLAYGRFGQGQDIGSYYPPQYFQKKYVKNEMLKAFNSVYDIISSPQLVHDGPLERITWLAIGKRKNMPDELLFWAFGYPYSRSERQKDEHA